MYDEGILLIPFTYTQLSCSWQNTILCHRRNMTPVLIVIEMFHKHAHNSSPKAFRCDLYAQ